MKLPNPPKPPKLPETTTDLIVLLLTAMVGSLTLAIIVMGLQERKIPPEFKDIALLVGGIVGGALTANRLSS
jgi:hypothetical protein